MSVVCYIYLTVEMLWLSIIRDFNLWFIIDLLNKKMATIGEFSNLYSLV